MKIYYVLILTIKNKKRPLTFDLILEHEITNEDDFRGYYKKILKQHSVNPKSVVGVALHKIGFDENKHHYVVIATQTNNRHVTYDFSSDDPNLNTTKVLIEFGDAIPNGSIGILIHKVNQNLRNM